MSGVIKFVVVNAVTIALTVVLYLALTNALMLWLTNFYLGYDAVNGANDAEAIIVVMLLWDRLFGPFSHMIRQCYKRTTTKTDDYT